MNHLEKKEILGVGITDAREDKILEYIFSSVKNHHEKYYIVTPNPEILTFAHAHPEYRAILNKAEIALCDGVGLLLASKLLAHPITHRVTGVDLLESICKRAAQGGIDESKKPVKIGFLGAGKGVALRASERLSEKYPGLKVDFVAEELDDASLKMLKSQSIDILFVAFGFPKQEKWMAEHLEKLPVKIMMGVGGAFDYISGNVPRAPKFVRSLGLEWLYRLIRQPWRLKRQLALPTFLFLVLKEKTT